MTLIRPDIDALQTSPIIQVWQMGFDHPGTIGLWAGESDLPTPAFICDAAARGMAAGRTFYTHNRGVPELRSALQAYYHRLHGITIADARIAITSSGMNAVMLIAQAVIGPGDNMVAISPSWPNALRTVEVMGGETREVALASTPEGWKLDMQALFDACDDRTKMIYYASPGNPTGWIMEEDETRALLDFARKRGIALMSDEVYHRIVYDRPVAASILELAEPDDAVFVVNSFSKAWAMTGWRLGWMIYPPAYQDALEKLIQYNTSGGQAFLQDGATAALNEGEPFVEEFVARCRAGWSMVSDRLSNMPRVKLIPNAASLYSMFSVDGVADTLTFCKRAVVEAGVGLAPGEAFGKGAEGYIRLCYARGQDQLDTALTRLQGFIQSYPR